MQWWWCSPRSTDRVPQPFWFDAHGRPAAAVIATDWGGAVALDPIVLPDAAQDRVARVVEIGVEHARAVGLAPLEVVVDGADRGTRALLEGLGFVVAHGAPRGVVAAWLVADARPPVGLLHAGYRLRCRLDTSSRPHHLVARSGPDVEARACERRRCTVPSWTSSFSTTATRSRRTACSGSDPITGTGLVEPMRTEAAHQGRGLARYLLAAGIERLVAAGARRVKVCFQPGSTAARRLYLGAGFEMGKETVVYTRAAAPVRS